MINSEFVHKLFKIKKYEKIIEAQSLDYKRLVEKKNIYQKIKCDKVMSEKKNEKEQEKKLIKKPA